MKREEKMISITLPKTAEAKEGIKKGEGGPHHISPFPGGGREGDQTGSEKMFVVKWQSDSD